MGISQTVGYSICFEISEGEMRASVWAAGKHFRSLVCDVRRSTKHKVAQCRKKKFAQLQKTTEKKVYAIYIFCMPLASDRSLCVCACVSCASEYMPSWYSSSKSNLMYFIRIQHFFSFFAPFCCCRSVSHMLTARTFKATASNARIQSTYKSLTVNTSQ